MASGWTNKGAWTAMNVFLGNATEPTTFYVALVTSATTPDVDKNTLSEFTEIAAGSGYSTGGLALARTIAGGGLDWASITEDDTDNRAEAIAESIVWTASGGSIPASGSGARWALLTDDNGTVGSRVVYAWWDLASDRTVSDGQTLTISTAELRATPA
jgi:hypothetical protein